MFHLPRTITLVKLLEHLYPIEEAEGSHRLSSRCRRAAWEEVGPYSETLRGLHTHIVEGIGKRCSCISIGSFMILEIVLTMLLHQERNERLLRPRLIIQVFVV